MRIIEIGNGRNVDKKDCEQGKCGQKRLRTGEIWIKDIANKRNVDSRDCQQVWIIRIGNKGNVDTRDFNPNQQTPDGMWRNILVSY